jgi:hypothetical protein
MKQKCRKLGLARIIVTRKADTQEKWEKLWKKPAHAWPITWGDCWKQCIQYQVNDFAAEAGFFIDVLGFPINAFSDNYAMFTGPKREFFFSIMPATKKDPRTPPNAIRLQFLVEGIQKLAKELEKRGVKFQRKPAPYGEKTSPMYMASFKTPNGISVDLWGMVVEDHIHDENCAEDCGVDHGAKKNGRKK